MPMDVLEYTAQGIRSNLRQDIQNPYGCQLSRVARNYPLQMQTAMSETGQRWGR